MERFEAGQTYDYICDVYKCTKRTKCYATFDVTAQSPFGGVRQMTKRLKVYDAGEYEVVFPHGTYSYELKSTDTWPALARA